MFNNLTKSSLEKNMLLYESVLDNIKLNHKSVHWSKPNKTQKLSVCIVEPRQHKYLKAVLYNMANIYANTDVSLYIVHTDINKQLINTITHNWTGVQKYTLNKDNLTISEYNHLLSSKSFYDMFQSEFVLIFQTDSLIFKQIPNEYFKYDYVGAPWKRDHNPRVGNGGFSLRKVSVMKHICTGHNRKVDPNEDLYFSKNLVNHKLPNVDLAKQFSVEQLYYESPVGIHQVYRFHNYEKLKKLLSNIQ